MLPAEIIQKLQQEIGEKLFYAGQTQVDMLKLLNLDYLTKTGYLESISSKMPVRNGLPIPWITYPALNFLESNTSTHSGILEFGGGTSTFFWALRGNPVTYLEFDSSWNKTISKNFTQLGAFIPTQPINLFAELSNNHRKEFERNFAQELSALKDNFSEGLSECLVNQILSADLIVIDGHYRNYFLELSSGANPNSVIVLDNAERSEYSAGVEHMINKGWNKVEFTGLGPVNPYEWTTTIFFKL
jgi:hypothetical protein